MPSNQTTLWDRGLCPTLSPKEQALAEENGITIIPITSPDYPTAFKKLPDPPPLLYVKGKLPPDDALTLGIVGTRAATSWGMECTKTFAKRLSDAGAWIISGLARGIDTAAHEASIGKTVAIIGSGLLDIYPKENSALAEQLVVISEFPLRTPPTRYNFPRRNRLIAALSNALLLTEAPIKSGAMITMRLGLKQKKPLFTLPGRAMNENYGGNHLLLKEGIAKLVETPEELAKHIELSCQIRASSAITTPLLSPDEQKIVDILSQSDVSLDTLAEESRLSISTIQVLLTKLVLRKVVEEIPGKRYKKS